MPLPLSVTVLFHFVLFCFRAVASISPEWRTQRPHPNTHSTTRTLHHLHLQHPSTIPRPQLQSIPHLHPAHPHPTPHPHPPHSHHSPHRPKPHHPTGPPLHLGPHLAQQSRGSALLPSLPQAFERLFQQYCITSIFLGGWGGLEEAGPIFKWVTTEWTTL